MVNHAYQVHKGNKFPAPGRKSGSNGDGTPSSAHSTTIRKPNHDGTIQNKCKCERGVTDFSHIAQMLGPLGRQTRSARATKNQTKPIGKQTSQGLRGDILPSPEGKRERIEGGMHRSGYKMAVDSFAKGKV